MCGRTAVASILLPCEGATAAILLSMAMYVRGVSMVVAVTVDVKD